MNHLQQTMTYYKIKPMQGQGTERRLKKYCETRAVDNWIMLFPNHLLLVVALATIPCSHGQVCKSS